MENNLYNLEEDINEEIIAGSSEYSLDDTLDEELIDEELFEEEMWNGESEEASEKKNIPFFMMLKAMFSPVEGFKNIRRSKISSDKFASDCFYPLITLASLARFTQLFYDADATITATMIDAVILFISMFFGYFTAILSGKWLLLKQPAAALTKNYGKIFVMTGFCSLCLFYILFRLYPLLAPVWGMLPIWTIYIIWKGTKFLGTKEAGDARTKVTLSFVTISSPLAWYWIFSEILPQ